MEIWASLHSGSRSSFRPAPGWTPVAGIQLKVILASSEGARRGFTRSPSNQLPNHVHQHCTGASGAVPCLCTKGSQHRQDPGPLPEGNTDLGCCKIWGFLHFAPLHGTLSVMHTLLQPDAERWPCPWPSPTLRPTTQQHIWLWLFPRRGWGGGKLSLLSAAVAAI